MGNIITVDLSRGKKITLNPVFQWNHGMTMRFINAALPQTYRVDFSNSVRGKAKSQIGSAEEGVLIPDELFFPGDTIYAWIVLALTEDSAIAEWQINLPIDPKAKPTNEPFSPQQQSVADQLIYQLNEAVQEANEAVSHYPKVSDNYWYVWDVANEEYVSTGIVALGEDGYSPIVTVNAITGGHRVTITDRNGDHSFDVMDGAQGDPGVSPVITVETITGGHRITIADADHPNGQSVDVMDGVNGNDGRGIVSIEKTGTSGLTDTYTITYTSGNPSTFIVTNGANGVDGVSPTVVIVAITGGHRITITDKEHPSGQSFDVMDGQNGTPGTNAYVYIRYSAAQPTQDSDMKTTPDAWMGIYSGDAATAPTTYTSYTWYKIKGDDQNVPSPSDANPQPLGTAAAGSSTDYSRADHIHAKPTAADIGAAPASTVIDTVSGSTPSITGVADHRYVCGEVSTLAVQAPASGCIDVVFDSGSTATVLTVTSAKTGVSAIKWANGFDPTSLDANTTYEVNILDGEFGVVGKWT